MIPTSVVAIVTVFVSCATALLIGYWHRKQMRQIELFRNDPSVGLKPPPSAAAKFVGRYYNIVLGVWFPLGSIAMLLSFWPLTRLSILLISVNAAGILFYVLARIQLRFSTLVLRQAETVLHGSELLKDMVEALKTMSAQGIAVAGTVESLAGLVATLQQRVSAIEAPSAEASEE